LNDGRRGVAAACFPDDPESAANIHAVHVLDNRRRDGEELTKARAENTLRVGEHYPHRRCRGGVR
jgi:hypothetical protein